MNDTALVALLRTLSENREAKRKLLARLAEIEKESASIRAQMVSLDAVIEPAELALMQMLSTTHDSSVNTRSNPVSHGQGGYSDYAKVSGFNQSPGNAVEHIPPHHYDESLLQYVEAANDLGITDEMSRERMHPTERSGNVRFNDFRIPQAATIVLREARRPLHVSEIFRQMRDGGFEFRGQHQLISLAVSLSRSKRFRKVAPGTFELNPEFQSGQVA